MNKHFILFIFLCSTGFVFGSGQNYYLIDGLHEDNSVIKIWYTALGLLDEYDKGLNAGFKVSFDRDGRYFDSDRGANWWEYYFAFDGVGSSQDNLVVRLPRYKRSLIRFNAVCTMSFDRAHYLLTKYVRLCPEFQVKIDQIKNDNWPDDMPVVGVYCQNSMMPEAQKSWDPDDLCYRVKKEVKKYKKCKIILFTDSEDFLASFKNNFSSRFTHILCDKEGRTKTPFERGEHELLTLLLLAQCDVVISPGSYQSVGAKMLNPSLQLVELDTIPYALK